METINTINTIEIVTMIGSILYTLIKYRDKVKQRPTIKFDLTYIISMILSIYIATTITYNLKLELTLTGLILAFITGFSFNAGISAINSKIPIEISIRQK